MSWDLTITRYSVVGTLLKWLERSTLDGVDRVITLSEAMPNDLPGNTHFMPIAQVICEQDLIGKIGKP
jgi:hypothetical protein